MDTIPDAIFYGRYKAVQSVAVASGGDWNGDGFDDLFVSDIPSGNPIDTNGVDVYFGGTQPDLKLRFSSALSFIGDINRDGFDDFLTVPPLELRVLAAAWGGDGEKNIFYSGVILWIASRTL